jgi:hypothetical protein
MGTDFINITPRNARKCKFKCAYNFKYNDSNSTATNVGQYISFSYDSGKSEPVTYGPKTYSVSTAMLFAPSIHRYLGQEVNAELVIKHDEVGGGQKSLYVCVPIVQSSDVSSAGSAMTAIIQRITKYAPGNGEHIDVQFSLQQLIPAAPYFNYENTGRDFPGDYVVFGRTSAIPVSQATLASLTQIISRYSTNMTGTNLHVNTDGPNKTQASEGIYIDCSPTGSSQAEIDVVNDKEVPAVVWNEDMQNGVILVAVIVGLPVIALTLKYIYEKATKSATVKPL